MKFLDNDLQVPPGSVDDIQGNILTGFRRTKTDVLLIRLWGKNPTQNKAHLRGWIDGPFKPTTTATHETHLHDDEPLRNVFVSASGLRRLGAEAVLKHMDARFVIGSRSAEVREALNDRPVGDWEGGFRDPWDVVLLVAHNGQHDLPALVTQLGLPKGSYDTIMCNALDADGAPLNDPRQPRYEHFGFRDGMSNPILTNEARAARPIPAMERPVSCVLTPDPLGSGSAFGSYLVLRKLEQDVQRFRKTLDEHVKQLIARAVPVAQIQFGSHADEGTEAGAHINAGAPAATKDYRYAAQLVAEYKAGGNAKAREAIRDEMRDFVLRRAIGRDRGGYPYTEWERPLAERLAEPAQLPGANDFNYEADLQASVCPIQAHVRKTNPRNLTRDKNERRHTVARRGMPYGAGKDKEVGLLFLCAQSDIAVQFEHMQRVWANNNSTGEKLTLRPTPGYDNIIAQPTSEKYQERIYETIELSAAFYNCVSLRGSEYLFAPSLTGLKNLSA